MVKVGPINVFPIFLTLCWMAIILFCNFWETQEAQLTFSFFVANIVEIRAPGANLFPCLKDMISVSASNLATFRLPFALAIRYLECGM